LGKAPSSANNTLLTYTLPADGQGEGERERWGTRNKERRSDMRAMIAVIVGSVALAVPAWSETIRLPARYVETTYTVHMLTGTTSDENTKEKLVDSPLEVTKHTDDGESIIRLTAKAGQGKDRSDESQGSIPFVNKDEVVALLKSLPQRISKAKMKPADGSEKIFEGDDVQMTFVTEAKHRKAYVDMVVGDRTYVLRNQADIEKLMKIIVALK
jgi:hypothetical protein